MSQQRGFDTSIPVLTELFVNKPEPQAEPAPLAARAAVAADETVLTAAAQTSAEQGDAGLEARALDAWTELEWHRLEQRLSARILQQLQGRVDFVLEQRLRDSMEEVLHGAMAALTTDIRAGLQQTIETIVVRAVAQELAHLQTLKN